MTPPDIIKPKTTLWNKGNVYPACLFRSGADNSEVEVHGN